MLISVYTINRLYQKSLVPATALDWSWPSACGTVLVMKDGVLKVQATGRGQGMEHDRNFKNLFVDYSRESLALFAGAEARAIDATTRITPIRQEQGVERLGGGHRELDVPLLVECGDAQRAVLLFAIEEETTPARFSVHRLVHYCTDLSTTFKTDRVIPVVVFLRAGTYRRQLLLGSPQRDYLRFEFLHTVLAELRAVDYLDSPNIVARLTLPTMAFAPEDKLEVIAAATRGLTELEPDLNRRLKYADFIDIYAMLTDDEREHYHRRYPEEAATMTGFSQRFTEIGRQQGLEQGLEQGLAQGLEQGISRGRREGEARVILRQLARRVGPLTAVQVSRVEALTVERLEALAEGLLEFMAPGELDRWLDEHA